jgi:tetratricopeptide (TPR) repeat protein
MAHLTLCTIARDEQELLPGCLDSVRGAIDRMIVVDTGSTDATASIAAAAGALVVRHGWDDDFAAARNAALEHVDGGFVLVLDADERLAPGHGPALRALVERGGIDGALLELHDASRAGATPEEVLDGRARRGEPMLLARLLRRTGDLRWEGLVHEHVTGWARGKRIVASDVAIVHYGAIPEVRAQKRKRERNLGLLERVCAREPDNVVFRTHLAHELLEAGDAARARAEAERAWRALEAQHARGSPAPSAITLATLRAFLALRGDELDLAAATLGRARDWSGAHPNLDLLACVHAERALLAEAEPEAAARAARAALAGGERALGQAGRAFAAQVLPGATSWATATRLGTLRLLLGEPEAALAAFERALAAKPGHGEALLGCAEALILTGRAAEVLAAGAALAAIDAPDAWILAALAAHELGGAADSAPLLARAEALLAEREPIAPHRRYYLDELQARARSSAA